MNLAAVIFLVLIGLAVVITAVIVGLFVWRAAWAMRNPEAFRELVEREAREGQAYRNKRYNQIAAAENERLRLGKPSWALRSFGAMFALAGLLFAGYAGFLFYNLARAQWWSKADCTVVAAAYDKSSSRGAASYYPQIKYIYSFDDRNFGGENFDLIHTSYDWLEIKDVLKDYPPGKQISCYVNGSNPAESVITRSLWQYPITKYATGITFCFGAAGLFFYFARRRKPQTPTGESDGSPMSNINKSS